MINLKEMNTLITLKYTLVFGAVGLVFEDFNLTA